MSALIDALTSMLGADAVLTGDAIGSRYRTDWSRMYPATPLAVVLPRSTEAVSSILKLCHAAAQTVVPQGGMTGLAAGATPSKTDLCLSLDRMCGVEEIDTAAAAMTVLAGTTLQAVQEEAVRAGFEFSLDMGSRGSCQIGGALATNAGGIRVIQSGTARDQVLGLEVVLADGTILSSMTKVLKNNTGYDLKHWFVGSEGTLGVITRAVLRLRPKPARRYTALCGLRNYEEVLELLAALRAALGNELSALEVMWPDFFEFGVSMSASKQSPFPERHALYALVEQGSFDAKAGSIRFEDALSGVADAVVSYSAAETRALWEIRESTSEFAAQFKAVNYDISLPIGRIGEFAEECKRRFESQWHGHRSFFFGHVGDSNLHATVDLDSMPGTSHHAVDESLYSLVESYHGSISAEHGIGLLKRDFLRCSRSESETRAMWTIKKALDPKGILNPGKILM